MARENIFVGSYLIMYNRSYYCTNVL